MPTLSNAQRSAALIESAASEFENYLSCAAIVANRMVSILTDLSDADLTEYLNSQPQEKLFADFADHLTCGDAVNIAVSKAAALIGKSPQATVDIRPFSEKLAAQNRTVSYVDGVWSVTTNPPAIDPQPEEPITEDPSE